ncbi:hypothetical protein D3C81_1820050 [compost metagenome]
MVDLLHRVVAGLVLLELHAPAVELFNGCKAVGGIGMYGGLVDDTVIGDGNFLGVLLGCSVPRDDRVVQAIHAHADGTTALDVGLVQQQHAQTFVLLLGFDSGHRASSAAADDDDVVVLGLDAHALPPFWRSMRRRYWKASPR